MRWDNIFRKRQIIVFIALALIAGVGGVLYFISVLPEKQHSFLAWTATENDVEVKIYVTKSSSGQLSLSSTFTPTRPQFSLYSKDLPRDGLNGMGRPTLLEIVDSDSIKSMGPLEADRPAQNVYVKALKLSFPVYPVGPVTLSLPFESIDSGNDVSMEIALTYMACSEKTCLPPVMNKHVLIHVPASFFDN